MKLKNIKMIICIDCGETRQSRNNNQCKLCYAAYQKKWYEKNKDYHNKYRKSNPEKSATALKKWREKNKEYTLKYNKEWKENNPDYHDKYRENNKKEIYLRQKKCRLTNPGKHNAIQRKRELKKLQRTPKWLTKEHFKQIEEFYILAKELQWLSEDKLEVDHIMPLQGKNVSGLHVPWNLQILPKKINRSKSNKLIVNK